MEVINAENHIISALGQLYNSPDEKLRHQADIWLKGFQTEKIAWLAADSLLRKDNVAYEAQYYAAQTLYTKIQTQGHLDLTPESRNSLRDSLFTHLARHRASRVALVTKLSLCIAALALQMSTEWSNVIPSIMSSSLAQPEYSRCLLTLLSVFPEECCTTSIHVSRDQKLQLGNQLTHSTSVVIQVLVKLMQSATDSETQAEVFLCLASWSRLGGLKYSDIDGNPLVSAPFDALPQPKLFEPALEAACELVITSSYPEFVPLREYLISRVASLRGLFQQAVKDEDEEVARGLTRLFSEACEIYHQGVLLTYPAEFSLLGALLDCTAHPDLEIAAITFNCWRLIADALEHNKQKYNVQAFVPAYEALLGLIVKATCYPADSDEWPEDTLENFRYTRKTEIAAVLRSICAIVDCRSCLSRIEQMFQQYLTAYATTGDWRQVEGCLYCIRAIARCLSPQPQDTPVLTILRLLPQLPPHKEIQYTALLIVGRYADWLDTDPALLVQLFSFVIQGLQRADSAPSAALAFNNICASCHKTIATSYLQEILNVYAGVQSFPLRLDDHLEILKGLSYVVGALPSDKLVPFLQQICQPLVQSLQQATTTEQPPKLLSATLCKLAALFQKPDLFSDNSNNNMKIAEALWPILERTLVLYCKSGEVVDQLCRCVRYLLDCFPQEFAASSLLEPVAQNLIKAYAQGHHASLVRAATALIRTLGKSSDYDNVLWTLVENISRTTLESTTTIENMTANPDVVWEYALMIDRIATHSRLHQWMCKPGFVDSILQWGALALALHHREAIKAVAQVMDSIIKLSSKQDLQLHPIVERHGAALVQQLFAILTQTGPYAQFLRVCEVLKALRAHYKGHFQNWITATLQVLPLPDAEKSKFLTVMPTADEHAFHNAIEDLMSSYRKYNNEEAGGPPTSISPCLRQDLRLDRRDV